MITKERAVSLYTEVKLQSKWNKKKSTKYTKLKLGTPEARYDCLRSKIAPIVFHSFFRELLFARKYGPVRIKFYASGIELLMNLLCLVASQSPKPVNSKLESPNFDIKFKKTFPLYSNFPNFPH
jgi:hypothetical protein